MNPKYQVKLGHKVIGTITEADLLRLHLATGSTIYEEDIADHVGDSASYVVASIDHEDQVIRLRFI